MSAFPLEQVAAAAGAPLMNVRTHWPLLVDALARELCAGVRSQAGAIATIAVETGPRRSQRFAPVTEFGPRAYFDKYEPGTRIGGRLGNTEPGDGYRFRGRGFIQLTGRANYRAYGKRLDLDLEVEPDRALEPEIAARIFASYWRHRGVAACAEARQWAEVRKRVNGGYTHFDRFAAVVNALLPGEIHLAGDVA